MQVPWLQTAPAPKGAHSEFRLHSPVSLQLPARQKAPCAQSAVTVQAVGPGTQVWRESHNMPAPQSPVLMQL